jgi:tetratricopeptide (TPR) repeat protein
MMRDRAAAVALLVVGGLLVTAHAEGPVPTAVGTKVITRYRTPLRAGSEVVDTGDEFRVYTVKGVNGDWMWLVAGSVSGWARSGEVVAFEQAVDFYTKEIEANPGGAFAAHLRRAAVLTMKGETDAALADYNEALRLDPKSLAALNGRAVIWSAKGAHDRAIADYNAALRLRPDYVPAIFDRALTWSDQENYDDAIAGFSEVIRLDPKMARAYSARGYALNMMEQYDQAIADFDQALRLDPRRSQAYFNRGVALIAKERYDAAIADLTEFLKLEKTDAQAFALRATAWKLKGKTLKAIADLDEAIRLDPKDSEMLYRRGMAWLEVGNDSLAIDDFTAVIRLDPREGMITAGLARGTAWAHIGEFAKAVGDFEDVIALDPDNSAAHHNLAYIRASCPDPRQRHGRKAVALATRACALSAEPPPIYVATLAAAYAEAGNFAGAVATQEKAIQRAANEEEKAWFQERLALYKAGKPFHDALRSVPFGQLPPRLRVRLPRPAPKSSPPPAAAPR